MGWVDPIKVVVGVGLYESYLDKKSRLVFGWVDVSEGADDIGCDERLYVLNLKDEGSLDWVIYGFFYCFFIKS